jgi:phenylpropionate dioxygenase-like ring-hydroxylating dioxygenase large terminal subunit
MSRFPFTPYPTGWFQVAYSDELPKAGVKPLQYFGRELVLFRSEDGAAHVLDAYCPHLGAHLGVGGKVQGSALECPFHHWRIDGSGRCVAIPTSDKIPPGAQIKSWPVEEHSGVILVFNGDGPPPWRVPPLPAYGDDSWTPYVKRRWRIRTHVREITENIVDGAHFRFVHGTLDTPQTRYESDGHVFRSFSTTRQPTPRGPVDGRIEGEAHGIAYWHIHFRGIHDLDFLSAATPVDAESVDLFLSFTYRKGDGADGVGKALIDEVCRQVDQDVPIWEHKTFREKPLYTAGDAAISALRSWSRQFL